MSKKGHVSRARLEGAGAAHVRLAQRQQEPDIDDDLREASILECASTCCDARKKKD